MKGKCQKKKIYRVIGERTEIYGNYYEATSKAEAIRKFNSDVDEGVDWYDSGRMVIRAILKSEPK